MALTAADIASTVRASRVHQVRVTPAQDELLYEVAAQCGVHVGTLLREVVVIWATHRAQDQDEPVDVVGLVAELQALREVDES